MAEPRKIFRIEETAAGRLEQSLEPTQAALRHAEIMRELAALRTALGAANTAGAAMANGGIATAADVDRLETELAFVADVIRGGASARPEMPTIARIADELKAVMNGTDLATQKVLAAAEEIDQAANGLSAALKGTIEQDAAQDIRDLVVQIFEACNFQDIVCQRVTKVMATLAFVEDHIDRVLDQQRKAAAVARDETQPLHGPRLDGDDGHTSQPDIDALFAKHR